MKIKHLNIEATNIKTKNNLSCGNINFKSPKDKIYLEIKLNVKNVTDSLLEITRNNFLLLSDTIDSKHSGDSTHSEIDQLKEIEEIKWKYRRF